MLWDDLDALDKEKEMTNKDLCVHGSIRGSCDVCNSSSEVGGNTLSVILITLGFGSGMVALIIFAFVMFMKGFGG